jgi:hypothetical protein
MGFQIRFHLRSMFRIVRILPDNLSHTPPLFATFKRQLCLVFKTRCHMKIEQIPNDITVFYIAATSFPDGIMAAHQKLHALVPFSTDRKYYGISRPENGIIEYKAATEETTPGDAEQYGCPALVLKKGNYICMTLHDYMQELTAIRKAFDKLLVTPDIDPEGYCVEWYIGNKDVKCMVRLKD